MKGKVIVLIAVICFVLTVGSPSVLKADTILFPVIAINVPNVTTIISVYNFSDVATNLRYIYRYKDSLVGSSPNITGSCSTYGLIVRPTYGDDLVSYDVSGTFEDGYALFDDPDNYAGSFKLALPSPGPRRGYLLVTHSDASGNRVDTGSTIDMMGEAVVLDILAGAAWGYKAINDEGAEDYTFISYENGGEVYPALYGSSSFASFRSFSFFPPLLWTTKFFVTPIGGDMLSDRTATVKLLTDEVADRGGIFSSWVTPIQHSVNCTAAIDIKDLMDSTANANVENTGGWSYMGVDETTSGEAIIYKLEYVLSSSTYGGTVNNGYLFSSFEF